MNRYTRWFAGSTWPASALVLLALSLGVLIGLVVVAPLGFAPLAGLAALSNWLLPLSGAALLVVLSVYNPLATMVLWLVLAPYSKHIPLDFHLAAGVPDITLTRLMVGWLLLLVVAQAVRGQRRLSRLTWPDYAYLLFVVAMFIGTPSSRWGSAQAFQAVFDAYVVPFLALFLARQLVRHPQDHRWVSIALLVVGVGLSLLIVREQLTGEVLFYNKPSLDYSRSFRKIVSLMGNSAPMGVSTALTLPLGLMLLVQAVGAKHLPAAKRGLAITLLAAANGFVVLGVFMTYNRASWLGIVVTLTALLILRASARRVFVPLLILLAVVAALSWQSLVASPAVTERLLEERSLDYRSISLELGLDMVRRQPLFGVGYGNFGFVADEVYGWDPASRLDSVAAAHNSYLFVAVSGGLLAFIPYVAWVAMVAWGGVQRWRLLSAWPDRAAAAVYLDALAAGVALFLTYFLASATFDNAETYIMNLLFFVGLGAVWGLTEMAARSPVDGRRALSSFPAPLPADRAGSDPG